MTNQLTKTSFFLFGGLVLPMKYKERADAL